MSTTLYDTARAVISRIERDHRRELATKEQALRSQASANAELLVENGELQALVEASAVVIARLTDGTLESARKLVSQELVEMGVGV